MSRTLYRVLATVSRLRRSSFTVLRSPQYIIPFIALMLFSWWVTALIYEPHITTIAWNNQLVIFFTVLAPLTCVLIAVNSLIQLFIRYLRGDAGSAMRMQFTIILIVAILTPTIIITVLSLSLIRFNNDLWLSVSVEDSLTSSLDALHADVDPHAEELLQFIRTRHDAIIAAADVSLAGLREGHDILLGRSVPSPSGSDKDGLALVILRTYRTSPAEREFTLTHRSRGRAYSVAGIRDKGTLVIAAKALPRELSDRMTGIANTLRYYKLLRSSRNDLEFILTMMFIFAAVVSAMAAMLIGFIISRSITLPLSALTDATRRIARDELSYRIKPAGNREMRDLMERFNIMVRDLKRNRGLLAAHERMVAWREVALRLAHEIKNPLTPINLNAELIAKEAKRLPIKNRAAFTQASGHILEQSATILSLVRDFSQFSFTTALSEDARSINAAIRQSIGSFSALPKTITLTMELSSRDLRIRMDPKKFTIAIMNLIKNAVESLNGEGKIGVTTRYDVRGGEFIIAVSDTGHGIPEEFRERIFEPYFTTKKKGSGLGLSVVETIIRDHGGTVEVSESSKDGTTFTVSFPLDIGA